MNWIEHYQYIQRLERRVKRLEQALLCIPFGEYTEALCDGCDAAAAWKVFRDAVHDHIVEVMTEAERAEKETKS